MPVDQNKLLEILLQGDYISKEDAAGADAVAKTRHISLSEALLDKGFVTKDLIGQAMAESFKVPYFDLNSAPVPAEQVLLIPEEIAKKYQALVVLHDKSAVTVTTDNPGNADLVTELKKIFPNKKIKITYSLTDDFEEIFVHYQKSLETRFSKILEKKERIAPELLEEIFEDALIYKASDIHFEPQLEEVAIRFRVDGVMHVAGKIPREFYENILNRIKVQSGLRIDEHFSAQDGSLHYARNGRAVDMRTSIVPTVEGEKVVLRVLGAYVEGLSLANLGLSEAQREVLQVAAEKPFGMILVTGPTGSGKTTTLYALLKLLNNSDVNITTIEDPVEYKLQGVNQIQVNAQTNLTFAKGLRSIVRQDPDTILVGEIRDQETAEIAVNAALTGHLLLSTFHANDAATAIPRLLDMGIEPFLLASTLEVVVAQRLARKLCDNCQYSVIKKATDFNTPQKKAAAPYFSSGKSVTFYEAKGCELCGHTGYRGRVAFFEFIHITAKMQELIVKKPSAQDIWKLARTENAYSLFEDGVEKVKNGITSLEELLRVAEPPKS